MIFVFGAMYQGMDEYVRREYPDSQIIELNEDTSVSDIDFGCGAVNGLEKFALGCVRRGESPASCLESVRGRWQDCVLIGTDISCGLVPMDATERLWREENGRMNNFLAANADHVVRLFCGLAEVLK